MRKLFFALAAILLMVATTANAACTCTWSVDDVDREHTKALLTVTCTADGTPATCTDTYRWKW